MKLKETAKQSTQKCKLFYSVQCTNINMTTLHTAVHMSLCVLGKSITSLLIDDMLGILAELTDLFCGHVRPTLNYPCDLSVTRIRYNSDDASVTAVLL